MVVLENSGAMVTIGSTQYLQPDYLSPLPTTVRYSPTYKQKYCWKFFTRKICLLKKTNFAKKKKIFLI